ncbi:MAG: GDP-mannose 4,6-dehydratase [Chloroflexi bacterium]|nr:GDP-mannose 4,6-dehydratase [Chloroflexota bacterium]
MTKTGNDIFWKEKPVVVTGAGGFIGSHLVETLARKGSKVKALVRYVGSGAFGWLSRTDPALGENVEVIQGNLRDAASVSDLVRDAEIVFHLGAVISIPYSYINPSEVSAVNVGGTLNVLNACREAGVGRLIHTSTSEVFGTAQYVPIDEKHPLQGQSPYSASKIAADKLVESYWQSFRLPAVTVRPFNTFGPRQSVRAVIPTIAAQLLKGPEVRLGSLSPTRDFTFVLDTVAGMMRAAQAENVIGRHINLGTGQEISIRDLVDLMARLMGVDARPVNEERRVRPEGSEVERLLSDNSLARSLLGWSPAVSLDEGLSRTIEWIREHQEVYGRALNDYVV